MLSFRSLRLRLLFIGSGLVLVATTSVTPAWAQSPLQVKTLSYQGTMPYVEPTDAAVAATVRVAARINQALYLELLDQPAPIRRQDGLKVRKRGEGDGPAPISDISFVVDRADQRLLALSVTAEGCGAYCEGFTRSFVFDAGNGRELQATDLFTAAGAQAIAAVLARQRDARIKAEIRKLKAAADPNSKAGKALTEDERESKLEAAEMFEACLPQYAKPDRGSAALGSDEIRIKGAAIAFVRGRCSNHMMQALDTLGEFINSLPLKDLVLHLSAYGKFLLGVGPAAPAPTSPFGQVLVGKVGTAPITMRLRRPYGAEENLGGVYYYERFRTPISLFGPRRGEAWELKEDAEEGKARPVMRFTVSGDRIIGEWIGADKRLPLEAGP